MNSMTMASVTQRMVKMRRKGAVEGKGSSRYRLELSKYRYRDGSEYQQVRGDYQEDEMNHGPVSSRLPVIS